MTPDAHLTEHLKVIEQVRRDLGKSIAEIASLLCAALADGRCVFWCGNGGSAADSQHLAAELVGRFEKDRRALRSVSLTTDTSILTAVSNDMGFDEVFSRQIEALANKGDILVAISTSGDSKNVLNAIDTANQMGLTSIGLLGKSGGAAKSRARHCLVVPSNSTARIQEAHIVIGHILCDLVERKLSLI